MCISTSGRRFTRRSTTESPVPVGDAAQRENAGHTPLIDSRSGRLRYPGPRITATSAKVSRSGPHAVFRSAAFRRESSGGVHRESSGSVCRDSLVRRATVLAMDENRARRVVDRLRDRGVPAHLAQAKAGVSKAGVRVVLFDGREALWDTDGTAGLEAQVLRDGVLVGFVPVIESSEDFDDDQVVDAIARTGYDEPIARPRRSVPPPAASLPREGGFFRRFREGFRE